jgi:hypothetical protein
MNTHLVNEEGEFKAWRLLGKVGAISATIGLVVGLGLGLAGHANAPESNAGSDETAYAAARIDHSRIAATGEPEAQPATF